MKLGAVVVIMVLLGAGCSSPASPPVVSPPASDVVFFASERGITVADNRGAVLSADATVASADFSTLYAVRGDRLVTVDATGNRELASAAVPGGLTARVVSTSGRLVALTRGAVADRPAGREKTTIVLADPSGTRPAWSLELPGNFEPEAFSADDAYLFVLEYLPANAPERYRVRRVEVDSGMVEPLLLRDKRVVPPGAEEEMRGEGRQAVLSPDRTRLYTLYLHQGDHQHTRDLIAGRIGADGRAVHAFVHVLSLTEGWAYCLDLPDPFGQHPATGHALTISPDGRTLYIGELTTGQIAVADTSTLTITQVTPLGSGAPADAATMATSPDGTSLYIGSSNVVRRLDSTTLRVANTWPQPAPVRGLTPAKDGRSLFIGHPNQVSRVDTATGLALESFPAAGLLALRGSAGVG